MQRARFLTVAWLPLVIAACGDEREPSSPDATSPAAVIFDGTRDDAAEDFFFLPPIMPDPSGHDNFDHAAFNATLAPMVSICQLAADPSVNPTTDCALQNGNPILIASFPSSDVQVSVADEHYQVNWHTDQSPVLVDRFYRIQVFVGSTRVGFADIDPVSSGRELRNLRSGEVIPLLDGRTLPIKFRIEHGVLCENKSDCLETVVTNTGGTFLTNTRFAGIRFEPNFLPPGVDAITLTIERVPVGVENACHGASNPRLWRQFEACYSIETDPDLAPLGGIRAPATFGKCTELATTDPLYDMQLGYKSRDGENLMALPNVPLPVDFGLDCEGFTGTIASAPVTNPLLRLALAGWRGLGTGVGRVFGVKRAYAVDLGLGDRIRLGDSFSNINWGIGLDGVVESGGEQSVGFGMAAEPLEVLITHGHIHEHVDGDDVGDEIEVHPVNVGGVPVTFTVTTGTGWFALDVDGNPIRTTTVMTSTADADMGIASVGFTADPNGVDNVVTATAPTLSGEPMIFQITGLPSDLVVEGLTRSDEAPTSQDALSWQFVVRNAGDGTSIPSTARLTVSVDGSSDGPVATRDIDVPQLAPGATFAVDVDDLEAVGPLAVGDYVVNVTVDAPGTVVEADEENNTAAESFSVSDPIDLTVRIVEILPAAATTHDAVRFIVEVQNVGSTLTLGTTVALDLGADVDGPLLGVPSLEPGAITTLASPPTSVPFEGVHVATATLDPENIIPESNETNNITTLQYTIAPPPDLRVESIALFPEEPNPPPGSDATFFVFTVANGGTGRSRPTVARYTIGPNAPDLVFVPAVDPGQTVVVGIAKPVPTGSYRVIIELDPFGEVGETDESNNTGTETFTSGATGAIEGQVHDALTQVGLAGALVTLLSPTGAPVGEVTTDAEGGFRFEGLAAGEYTYTATLAGHAPSTGTIPLQEGQTLFQPIALARLVEVGGIVTDFVTGQPIPGAMVQIQGLPVAVVTDDEGRYLFAQVRAGTGSTITATRIGYVPQTQGISVGNFPVTIDFQLLPAQPLLTIQGQTLFTVVQPNGLSASWNLLNGAGGTLTVNSIGPVLRCTDITCTESSVTPWLTATLTPATNSAVLTVGNAVTTSEIPVGEHWFVIEIDSNASNNPHGLIFRVTIAPPITPIDPPDGGGGGVVPPDGGGAGGS